MIDATNLKSPGWQKIVAELSGMLTALSTVFGMIPIAPTVFWGPMAFAIMGGLLAGTLLTLVFLPALYVAVYGARTAPAPNMIAAPTA